MNNTENICGDCANAGIHPLKPTGCVLCLEGYGVRAMKAKACKCFKPLKPGERRREVIFRPTVKEE